jgi:putative hydrolase of the HAD superfamily
MRIFFDIDGVLIDGFHMKAERRKRWDKDLEKDLGIRHDHFQEIFRGWFLDVLQGKLDFEEALTHWLEANGYKIKASQVIDYWHEKDSNLNRPVFDVVEKLAGREGIELYTATNQSHARIRYLRDILGWKDYFTDFYYSARLGCLKHDPLYFSRIEDELGFNPHTEPPLYFDDDPKNIEVSSARGWNAVLVDGPEDVVNNSRIQELLAV